MQYGELSVSIQIDMYRYDVTLNGAEIGGSITNLLTCTICYTLRWPVLTMQQLIM